MGDVFSVCKVAMETPMAQAHLSHPPVISGGSGYFWALNCIEPRGLCSLCVEGCLAGANGCLEPRHGSWISSYMFIWFIFWLATCHWSECVLPVDFLEMLLRNIPIWAPYISRLVMLKNNAATVRPVPATGFINHLGCTPIYGWLVVWNMAFLSPYIGNVIIPTDFHIFQRGRCTTNQMAIYIHLHLTR